MLQMNNPENGDVEAAHVETEEWQLGELQAGIAELDSGQEVSHEKVSKWLNSCGKPGETRRPQ
jgi:predicted transcriptional regulator